MHGVQDAFNFFDDAQRSKSAPSIKNLRPVWTIRIRSSSMILRKCRTENPASSAAFGMSRNVFVVVNISVDLISPSFSGDGYAACLPDDSGGAAYFRDAPQIL